MICSHCGLEIDSWCETESRTYERKFNKDGDICPIKSIEGCNSNAWCPLCGHILSREDIERLFLEVTYPEACNIK